MNKDCNTCIYKEGSCYPSTTIFDKDKTCKSYAPDYEGYIAELEKENVELKEKWLQATDEGTSWAHLKSLEVENAELKELLKDITSSYGSTEVSEGQMCLKIKKAEQFLKKAESDKDHD